MKNWIIFIFIYMCLITWLIVVQHCISAEKYKKGYEDGYKKRTTDSSIFKGIIRDE